MALGTSGGEGRNGYNRSLKLQEYATVYFNEIKYTEIPSDREDLLERYKKMGGEC